MIRRHRRFTAMLPLAAATLVAAGCGSGHITNTRILSELAAIRKATAKYKDVRVARAAGYLPTICIEFRGQGAMGYHYRNLRLVVDASSTGKVNPLKPQIILYGPGAKGHLQMVGVEYEIDHPRSHHPSLPPFGHFDGPMAGHYPGQPTHYDLHVWIWKHNPSGMFAQWNPDVHCRK